MEKIERGLAKGEALANISFGESKAIEHTATVTCLSEDEASSEDYTTYLGVLADSPQFFMGEEDIVTKFSVKGLDNSVMNFITRGYCSAYLMTMVDKEYEIVVTYDEDSMVDDGEAIYTEALKINAYGRRYTMDKVLAIIDKDLSIAI